MIIMIMIMIIIILLINKEEPNIKQEFSNITKAITNSFEIIAIVQSKF